MAKARRYFMSAQGNTGTTSVGFWFPRMKVKQDQNGVLTESLDGDQIKIKDLVGLSKVQIMKHAAMGEQVFTKADNAWDSYSWFFTFNLEKLSFGSQPIIDSNLQDKAKAFFIHKYATPKKIYDDSTGKTFISINTPLGSDEPLVETVRQGIYYKEIEYEGDEPPKDYYDPDHYEVPDDPKAVVVPKKMVLSVTEDPADQKPAKKPRPAKKETSEESENTDKKQKVKA